MVPPCLDCGMMKWDGQLGSHAFRLLSKHGVLPCLATLPECQIQQMPRRSWKTGGDHQDALVLCGWRLQQDLKSSNLCLYEANQRGSELSTLETDVYIWRYALLVVRARKEEDHSIQCLIWFTCCLHFEGLFCLYVSVHTWAECRWDVLNKVFHNFFPCFHCLFSSKHFLIVHVNFL